MRETKNAKGRESDAAIFCGVCAVYEERGMVHGGAVLAYLTLASPEAVSVALRDDGWTDEEAEACARYRAALAREGRHAE